MLEKENVCSITFIPWGESGGYLKIGMECNEIKSKTEMLNRMIIRLAGKVSEKIFFPDEEYLGLGSDILKVSSIANKLLSFDFCYGLNYRLRPSHGTFDNEAISDDKLKKIETKCDEVLNECFEKATNRVNS